MLEALLVRVAPFAPSVALAGVTGLTRGSTQAAWLGETITDVFTLERCAVIGEGRFWTPEDVRRGFALGAHGIVVGAAITNPREITKRFKRLAAS